MKSKYLLLSIVSFSTLTVSAQSAIDAQSLNQLDMKGTARYMSMGGAFGALGGDLTTISKNPAGIGVYRNNEVGLTVNLDVQSAKSTATDGTFSTNQTKFLLNNIGGVLTLRLPSKTVPNLNFGFTYNKTATFNRRYGGALGAMQNSMTNWIAGMTNSEGATVGDLESSSNYNPYNPMDGGYEAPWLSILAYDSFFINPTGDPDSPKWEGQFGNGTTGSANFLVSEQGGIDSFNIAFGGNFGNKLFWGMDFDITSLNYTQNYLYGENMQDAYVESDRGIEQTTSVWQMRNYYNMTGTGFAYKLGLIFKPIQEFRVGFAFHTPTYYTMSQTFGASTEYSYNGEQSKGQDTNGGIPGYTEFRYHSPWHIIVSAAGVIGNSLIVSADYEWTQTSKMQFRDPAYYYNDWSYTDSYNVVNYDITNYYKDQNTFRLGAEFRVTPKFSVRAGYSNVSSPVKSEAKSGQEVIYTAGTRPSYIFEGAANYYTAGIGFRTGGFYADLAYVHKHQSATWNAFDSDPDSSDRAPRADLSFASNQVVLSLGYKF